MADISKPQRPEHDEEATQDGVSQAKIQGAMDQLYVKNDQFLFGIRHTPIALSTLHPEPVQIFRLWQIYLDNIDPLLKVTHTPTLQGRIIEAASNVASVKSTLEALMFSIYAMSIMSLTVDECQVIFNSPRDELLEIYQFGCQQSLLNCGYLRTNDRECLTAYFLFLLSIGPNTDPRSLSPMLGVAMRIAIRMGIHREPDDANSSSFELEMRRRLWWALKLIDSRIGELADSKSVAMDPTWDCKIPLNVNDTELRPEMKSLPSIQGSTSDALFVVVRSFLGDFIRFAEFHLDFTNPQLKSVAKAAQHDLVPESRNIVAFENLIEDQYLRTCNPDNPLHLMTLCMARSQLAKYRLLEHYWRFSDSPESQTDAQRDIMIRNALTILECDAKIMSSPSTKGYRWLLQFYFPFPAYVHVLQDLRRRPFGSQAMEAWRVLSNHFEVRVNVAEGRNNPFFDLFTNIVLMAWKQREDALIQQGEEATPPSIVSIIKEKMTEENGASQDADTQAGDVMSRVNLSELPVTGRAAIDHMPYEWGTQYTQPNATFLMHPQLQFQSETNSLHLRALDWTLGGNAFW
ncbi:hypothetical protein VI817_009928 [Penicillium citrinum]|nr:hypothetical protein VI817_009928 [Penicillium citrinum]